MSKGRQAQYAKYLEALKECYRSWSISLGKPQKVWHVSLNGIESRTYTNGEESLAFIPPKRLQLQGNSIKDIYIDEFLEEQDDQPN